MDTEQTPPAEAAAQQRLRWNVVLRVVLAGAAVGLVALFAIPDARWAVGFWSGELLAWTDTLGPAGPIVVIGVYIVSCVLMLPGSALTLATGALFGVVTGTVTVSIGSTLGASVAFLVGRTVARGAIEKRVAANPKFAAIDRAVGEQGFKIVLLTRLSPIFPFNLLNYAYGLTRVSFWKYMPASWIGMLPGTVMYVYLGYAGRAAAQAASGQGEVADYILKGVGLLATIVVTVVITRVARKALKQAVAESQPQGADA